MSQSDTVVSLLAEVLEKQGQKKFSKNSRIPKLHKKSRKRVKMPFSGHKYHKLNE